MTPQTQPNRSVSHGVFTIERTYPDVRPQRVFDAFASIEGKNGWFTAPNDNWRSSSGPWISRSVAASG